MTAWFAGRGRVDAGGFIGAALRRHQDWTAGEGQRLYCPALAARDAGHRQMETDGRMARRIGILGGSFNPAHRGHLDLSLAAIHRLGLDQVWWMVSPQNPLKPADGMAPFAERVASARAMARDKRIKVTDIEARLQTRYTAETLA